MTRPAAAPPPPPGAPRAARGALLLLVLLAAILPFGCVAFPHGAYWPAYRSRLPERAGADGPGAGAAADWSSPAEAHALRARLKDAVARRWADETLAESAREMDLAAGRWIYGEAMRALAWFYVDDVSYRDLVVSGIESLRAALDDPRFRKHFPAAEPPDRRARLAEALDILSLKARAADPVFACQAGAWLEVAVEKNRALLGLPDGAVLTEFLFGATDALDPYTCFLTEEMLRGYRDRLRGAYAGIGAAVTKRGGRVFLEEVFAGGAAEEAGLRRGDELVAVGEERARAMTLAEVGRRLRGEAGTTVTLSVRPGGEGEVREVVLERAGVRLPSVRGVRMLRGEGQVGYLRLTRFKSGTERELRRAVNDLARRGARRLVVDLRGNPGGMLLEAVGAAGVFLAGGRVARTRGRALGADWTYDVPLLARRAWAGPLAVLVDGQTASAAEVLAAALARDGRATLFGEPTYGKGAAQVNLPILGTRTAVTITVARVYGPADRCLEGAGVEPDRRVAPPAEPAPDVDRDPVVRAAVAHLRAQRARAEARP